MLILGYCCAILMGMTLGLIGAGGSILTVPILIYFFHIKPILATTYSLLIVGLTALIGAIFYYQKKSVNFKAVFIFTIPSTIAVIATRRFLIPNLPRDILAIPKENFFLLVFAVLMLIAAKMMVRPSKTITKSDESRNDAALHQFSRNGISKKLKLLFGSLAVGLLTGLVGVGGGFLIVPTLIFLFKLEAGSAVGTSLAIIAINALSGFKSDFVGEVAIDWVFLAAITSMTMLGMLFGGFLSKKFDGKKLKKIFAAMVSLVAIFIILNQVYYFRNC